jgi:V/A-type H+-transporting ATPase subunit I
METVLDEHGFEERPIPAWEEKTPAAVYREAAERSRALAERAAGLRAALRDVGEPLAEELRRASEALSVQLRIYEAERNFGTTWAATLISGWVPAERADEVSRVVMEVSGGRAVVEIAEPEADEIQQGRVPSYAPHSGLLVPFQRLAQGYGVPSYTDVEPTLLFAVTFLLMFGIIFGDLGHGLCLLAIGLLTRRWARTAGARDIGFVIAASGVAGALSGVFFQGSFFGKSLADLGFPLTLGFEPIRFEGEGAGAGEHVVRYMLLAVGLGVVLITLGAALNIISRLRRKDLEGGLLGRFGLVGVIFYWGVLAFAVKLAVAGAGAADTWLVLILIVLPLAVLVLHRPVHALLTRGKSLEGEGPVMGLFQGLIEGLETVMVYVANTFSFLRVAAFALSHAALCFTIFVLYRLVNGLPGGPVWSAAVFILGTAVIIGLEGLIVVIQIMRLEYYEFFSKFFQGGGTLYEPFRLD